MARRSLPRSGLDELRAQLVALVGQSRLVVDASRAVRQLEHVEIAHVRHGLRGDLLEAAGRRGPARQARTLEPVLLGRGSPVVARPTVAQHAGEARTASVPGAGTSTEHRPVPVPFEAVGADGICRRHPILSPRLVEWVAADPGLPTAVGPLDERVLDARQVVAGEGGARLGAGQPLEIAGLQHVDPPMPALARRAAYVEPPA